jgi:transmembrane 9 superfamily member 2/4
MDYYRLPFCQPHNGLEIDDPTIGEFLIGERTKSSPYILNMKRDMYCEQVCIANLDSKVFKAIHHQYHNNWLIDNLPSASKIEDDATITTRYWGGFPIGYVSDDTGLPYIYNHVNIEIMYHPVRRDQNNYQIVRFTIQPFSIHHDFQILDEDSKHNFPFKVAKIINPIASCDETRNEIHTDYNQVVHSTGGEPQLADGNVLFTYDVIWIENKEVDWATRWDIYLTMDNAIPDYVHVHSIFYSFAFVIVLTGILVTIFVRNLRKDKELMPDKETGKEEIEEFGCKVTYNSPFLNSVFCGTGAQILCSSFMTIVCCFVGIASPTRKGSIVTTFLILYVLSGGVGGYIAARFYKSFQGEALEQVVAWTALGFPGITFFFFFLTHILLMESDHLYPAFMNVMVFLLCLWLGVNTPLVILGSQFGYKQDSFDFVCLTSCTQSEIPHQPWFLRTPMVHVFGACILFGIGLVDLYFILSSVWFEQYYYEFGFFLVVYIILVVVCAEMSLLCILVNRQNENYDWLWFPYYTAGSFAISIFLYCICFLMHLESTDVFFYFLFLGCMGIACFAIFLMMGFIGVYAGLVYTKIVYCLIGKTDKQRLL